MPNPALHHDARLTQLRGRLHVLLPGIYAERSQALRPTSMRSADLIFDEDGCVAWERIWNSFCDLALGGGPPHKGRLLSFADGDSGQHWKDEDHRVAKEICRGISLTTGLRTSPIVERGAVRVECTDIAMAEWLLRAVTTENVAVQKTGTSLILPACRHFRLEREIKSVVTVCAKTVHYWTEHMSTERKNSIAALFRGMDAFDEPLLEPVSAWRSIDLASIEAAVVAMQLGIAANVLCRREETHLMVPSHDMRVEVRLEPILSACIGSVSCEPDEESSLRSNAAQHAACAMSLSRG